MNIVANIFEGGECDPFEVVWSVFLISDGLCPSVTIQCDDFVVR